MYDRLQVVPKVNEDEQVASVRICRGKIFLPDLYSEQLLSFAEFHHLAVRELDVDIFLTGENPAEVLDVVRLALAGQGDVAVAAVLVRPFDVPEHPSGDDQRVVIED